MFANAIPNKGPPAGEVHLRALDISARFKRTEAELVGVFQAVEAHRVFLGHGPML